MSLLETAVRCDLPDHADHGGIYHRDVTNPMLEGYCFCGVAISVNPLANGSERVAKIDQEATDRLATTAKRIGMKVSDVILALHLHRNREEPRTGSLIQVIPDESILRGEAILVSKNSSGEVVDVVRAVSLQTEETKS